MTIDITVAFGSSNDTFSVRQFSVHESLSTPFAIELVAMSSNPDVDLAALTGDDAKFTLTGPTETGSNMTRTYRGVCLLAEQLQPETTGLSTYAIHIAPRLALLERRTNYRVFQHKSVPEIVKLILEEWNIEHEMRVDDTSHPELEYRVQYGESDMTFISRLLEAAGISYHFAQSEGDSPLILTDAPENNTSLPQPIPYWSRSGANAPQAYVSDVRVTHGLRSGRYRLRDFDFRHPGNALVKHETAGTSLEQRLEVYRYEPGSFATEGHPQGNTPAADDLGVARADPQHGQRLAQYGLRRHRGERPAVSFTTTATEVYSGTVFAISDHPRREMASAHKLLVTQMVLYGAANEMVTMSGQAVFASEAYRPALLTRRPRVNGIESATVVGPSGDEIHTDEFGRVRVQFHWDDHGNHDERSSCWLRVSQGWAGTRFGMIMLPRVGQEVLVSFLGGDPDQPVVVGRVYNGQCQVPHKLPQNKTISTWRSLSSPGGNGFNEFRFEDQAGDEEIYLHAERDLREEVGHDHRLTVDNQESIRIGSSQSVSVGASQTIRVGSNRSLTVGAKRFEKIGKGDDLVVAEGDKRIEVADGDYTVICENGIVELRNSVAHIRMKDDRIELHTGRGAALVLDGDTITLAANDIELSAVNDITIDAANRVVINGAKETDIHGGIIKLNC